MARRHTFNSTSDLLLHKYTQSQLHLAVAQAKLTTMEAINQALLKERDQLRRQVEKLLDNSNATSSCRLTSTLNSGSSSLPSSSSSSSVSSSNGSSGSGSSDGVQLWRQTSPLGLPSSTIARLLSSSDSQESLPAAEQGSLPPPHTDSILAAGSVLFCVGQSFDPTSPHLDTRHTPPHSPLPSSPPSPPQRGPAESRV